MSLLTWIILFSLLARAERWSGDILLLSETARTGSCRTLSASHRCHAGAPVGLLPHALEGAGPRRPSVSLTLLLGCSLFPAGEMVLWHCHTEHCEAHDPNRTVIIISASARRSSSATHPQLRRWRADRRSVFTDCIWAWLPRSRSQRTRSRRKSRLRILLHSGFSRGRAMFSTCSRHWPR